MTLLTTIASNLNSYTDLTAPAGQLYYQIEVISGYTCDPGKSYNSSRSNVVDNAQAPSMIISNESSKVKVYPNPAKESVNIEVVNYQGEVRTEVYDLIGNLIISTNERLIDLQSFSKGIYVLKIGYNNQSKKIKLIKK